MDINAKLAAESARNQKYQILAELAGQIPQIQKQIAKPKPSAVRLLCKGRRKEWHESGWSFAVYESGGSVRMGVVDYPTSDLLLVHIDIKAAPHGGLWVWKCVECGAEYSTPTERIFAAVLLAISTPTRIGRHYVARVK